MTSDLDLDSMAVVGHVADVVHAFKEAVNYLKRIRERRKTRPAPRGRVPDNKTIQDLEFSLARGQDVVRSHYERDYRRLGQPYARGDNEAANQLKSVFSELDRLVVVTLRNACQHDQHVDFLMLQDLSDESQDRAVMTLMQLHQRVLVAGNLEDIATGMPYSKRAGAQSRNPPRTLSEEPVAPAKVQDLDSPVSPDDTHLTHRGIHGPLTPELSPSQEQLSFLHQQASERDDFDARPKVHAIPIPNRQSPVSGNLSSSPSGPPPTVPLPPAPSDRHRTKRRQDELAAVKLDAERRAQASRAPSEDGRAFLDRTFAHHGHAESRSRRDTSAPPRGYDFQEPHPGVEVHPSRVDEHTWEQAAHHSYLPAQTDLSRFPHPRSAPRSTPAASSNLLTPPRSNTYDSAASRITNKPDQADSLSLVHDRNSIISTATLSSHGSRTSGASATSRATTSSSNASFQSVPSVPGIPMMSPARIKTLARVPEPIYEAQAPYDHQVASRTAEARRPSAPGYGPIMGDAPAPGSFPPIPPLPVEPARAIDTRRASNFSQQSLSSTSSGMPPSLPVRIITNHVSDASNSKMYMPTEANKFGGLCKGAWRAQIGDFKKAYQLQSRPAGVASNRMIDSVGCKSCNFQGKVAFDARGKKVPDRKIITARDTGVEYRWDYLFKSHLAMKNGTSAEAEYGCMFCCSEGKGTPVFKTMAAFIAHTGEHRPGAAGNNNDCQVPDSSVCERMDTLIGRSMSFEERFEVALPVAEFVTPAEQGPISPMSALTSDTPNGRGHNSGNPRY